MEASDNSPPKKKTKKSVATVTPLFPFYLNSKITATSNHIKGDEDEEDPDEKNTLKDTDADADVNDVENIENTMYHEIGVDEAGRGPLFGRVYTAAVVLPKPKDDKESSFKYDILKDSKRFHSEKKINEVAEYIKEHAEAWCVSYKSETDIDRINIRQAVLSSMHDSIAGCISQIDDAIDPTLTENNAEYFLLIDGNDFKPYIYLSSSDILETVKYKCIEGGDNKYCAIAAASILAKVERDKYVLELCES
ncbi:MAG: ribonuclease HII, partial [Candidatus Marinimicrobia bacterium]|nr:ribonuclease HII [Candidatus Neomarinimicrobiota bacterium]